MKKKEILSKIFRKSRILGLVGNSGTAKSSLGLSQIVNLKEKFNDLNVYVFGVEDNLIDYLTNFGIKVIHNKEDILDLKIKNSVIFIDEFGDVFKVNRRDKQQDRITKFFNRIEHLNNYLIISTARNGFWNKYMNGFVRYFFVKEIDFDNLINGTNLKRKVKGISNTSEYRLELNKSDFYIIGDNLTEKHSFEYNENLDSKKDNKNPFLKSENKRE